MPTMAGAFVYDLYKNLDTIDRSQALLIAIGFVVAFLSALVVVRTFLAFVSRYGLRRSAGGGSPSAWWRWWSSSPSATAAGRRPGQPADQAGRGRSNWPWGRKR